MVYTGGTTHFLILQNLLLVTTILKPGTVTILLLRCCPVMVLHYTSRKILSLKFISVSLFLLDVHVFEVINCSCLEMLDIETPQSCYCSPEGLLKQVGWILLIWSSSSKFDFISDSIWMVFFFSFQLRLWMLRNRTLFIW